jgi:hypothetical protein
MRPVISDNPVMSPLKFLSASGFLARCSQIVIPPKTLSVARFPMVSPLTVGSKMKEKPNKREGIRRDGEDADSEYR